MDQGEVRIDKWLWATRVFKTRTQAREACMGGHVKVDEKKVKPSRSLRAGEVVRIQLPDITRTVRVKDVTENRVGAKLVENYQEDLTPLTEYDRRKEFWRGSPAQRARGSGRPTKKERRETDRFFGL